MKKCSKCNTELIADKNWSKGLIKNRTLLCKSCKRLVSKEYYKNNKEKKKAYQERNKEKIKIGKRKNYIKNKDYIKKQSRLWAINNKGRKNAQIAKRHAQKLKATPKWYEKEKIKIVYEKAAWLEEITGLKYHVDHIIPLQGKNVCGLHVWNNLQILEASLNCSKNNKMEI